MAVQEPTVIIRSCREYDPQKIRKIIREGLELLDLRPSGKTLIKPNVVAAGDMFPHAFTRPEFTEGVVHALRDRDAGHMRRLCVGERSGITMPTRYVYKRGKYPQMARRAKVDLVAFEEDSQVEIPLYHPGRLRDSFYTPQTVAETDFFVNCPKFKAHPWTTVTFSLKAYIGIQDDRHRLLDHHHQLDEKVADLQYIIQPQFIAIDAITAGEGRMLTPKPFDMGLIIMGNNQVAFDAVCCHIIGLDPLSVPHIRMAYERGFGPVDLSTITIDGDVSLEQAQDRAKGFEVGLIRVEDYFEGTSIKAYGGRPPSPAKGGEGTDYCWGGCPGAFEEAIEILRVVDAAATADIPPLHVIFGRVDKPLEVKPGEKVIFMGDCASYEGKIGEADVKLDSVYRDRSKMSPLEAKHQDIVAKMVATPLAVRKLKREDFIRLPGCPVSVAEQVLALVQFGKLPNPYLDLKEVVPFSSAYLSWRTRTAIQRMFGKPYNKAGAALRGASRPQQNLPPAGVESPLELSSGS